MQGTVYLLHFDEPVAHARHYVGWALDVEARAAEHRACRGSPLVAALMAQGGDFVVARTWAGDRKLKRRIKSWKMGPRLCPVCVALDATSHHTNKGRDACAVCGADLGPMWRHNGCCKPCTLERLELWRMKRNGHRSVLMTGRYLRGRMFLRRRPGPPTFWGRWWASARFDLGE